MSIKCAIIPQVRNRNGELVDSRLFTDLLSSFSRDKAKDIYSRVNTTAFKAFNSSLEFDENGEPTLSSLKSRFSFDEKKEVSNEQLEASNGFVKDGKPVSMTVEQALQSANKFNNDNNESKIAVVETHGSKFKVVVSDLDSTTSKIRKDLMIHQQLAGKILDKMATNHLTIGLLSETEKEMANGVTDFTVLLRMAEGMLDVIRVSNDMDGIKAIPEEFAHLSIKALTNNPLVLRLLNMIDSRTAKEILGSEYDSYLIKYEFDDAKVAEEAAGKLVARHMFNKQLIGQTKYKNLLERAISFIKTMFRGVDYKGVNDTLTQANRIAELFAEKLLYQDPISKNHLRSINSDGKLYSLKEHNSTYNNILKKALDTEIKRYNIYKNRSKDSKFSEQQKIQIAKMLVALEDKVEEVQISEYIQSSLIKLEQLNQRILDLNKGTMTIELKAKTLRDIKNYLFSYKSIAEYIYEMEAEQVNEGNTILADETKNQLAMLSSLIDRLHKLYEKAAMPLFAEFVEQFTGKLNLSRTDIIDMTKVADKDINIFDRWLDAMSSSSDMMNRLMAQAVNKSKELARLDTINTQKRLMAALMKLEAAGHKDTKFMFNLDSNGNPTGNYIQPIDYDAFYRSRREFSDKIKQEIGDMSTDKNRAIYSLKMKEWRRENIVAKDGKFTPADKYINSRFNSMTAAQRAYYDEFMEIKGELDNMLPPKGVQAYKAVLIRKDLMERVKSGKSILDVGKMVIDDIKYAFINSADDIEYATKSALMDFEGNQVHTLPVYYTKRLEKPSELSMDATSTLIAYSSMAHDYDQMNKVLNTLEVGRDLLRKRKVIQMSGDKKLLESVRGFGKTEKTPISRSGEGTNVVDRLNDFFQMQVYGKYMDDSGYLVGKISNAKVADLINKATAVNSMALNALSGIANIAMGKAMMRIESAAGEFFKWSDVVTADKLYGKEVVGVMGQLGDRVKSNKLDLWNELFNVLQDHELEVRDVDMDKRNAFSRHAKMNTLMFIQGSGEHWMLTRTSLALSNQYKMKSPTGQLVSLYDAMEVRKEVVNGKTVSARLVVKDGYTKADGSQFTDEDILAFSKKSKKINQKMHGIYNKLDKNAVLKLAVGRMAMLFRKWIPEALNRRFQHSQYDFDLDMELEGYYRTLGKFIVSVGSDLRHMLFDIATKWNDMTAHEKANMRRSAMELGNYALISLVAMLLGGYDDKGKKGWMISMIEYQLFRMKMEMGAITPTPLMAYEAFNIILSPAAGVRTLQDFVDIVTLVNPQAWSTELKTGRYKGHSKAYKQIMDVLPMNRTVHKVLNPQEAAKFFKD